MGNQVRRIRRLILISRAEASDASSTKGPTPLVVILITGGGSILQSMAPVLLGEDASVTGIVMLSRAFTGNILRRMKEADTKLSRVGACGDECDGGGGRQRRYGRELRQGGWG